MTVLSTFMLDSVLIPAKSGPYSGLKPAKVIKVVKWRKTAEKHGIDRFINFYSFLPGPA